MALPKLTARQQEVLELIQTSITATGAPPTRAEIAQALGFKSANAAEEHLKALARKGAIELVSGTSRGIRLRLHAAQEQVTQRVPESMFERRPDYLLRVRGMSMRDLGILDGDLLAVQATQQARSGQIVVARLDDEVTVKRLELLPSGARLHPANPDYPIIEVRDAESFAIEGLAVGLVRPGL